MSIYVSVHRKTTYNGLPGSTLAEVWTISITDEEKLSQSEKDSQDGTEEANKKVRRQSLRELEPSLGLNIIQDYFVPDNDKIRKEQI